MKKELGNLFKSIFKSLEVCKEVAAVMSCAFFIGLLVVAILLPGFSKSIHLVFVAGMLSTLIFCAKNERVQRTFYIVGSAAFFLFFLSKYFFEGNILSQVFAYYQTKIEYMLNFGALFGFLVVVLFILISTGFPLMLSILEILIKKLPDGKLEDILLKTLEAIGLLWVFAILIGIHIDPLLDWVMKQIFKMSNLIIPFLGFSLIYLHINLLVRKVYKYNKPV